MAGAIKTYDIQGNGIAINSDANVASQIATVSCFKNFFNKLNTLLNEFKDEWGIERVSSLSASDTLVGETSGTFTFSETYKIDGFITKYLVFSFETNYIGRKSASGQNFYIDVYDSIPNTKISGSATGRVASINYLNYVSSASTYSETKVDDIYNVNVSVTIPLKITKTLNCFFINLYRNANRSMLSGNGYGIFNFINNTTEETYKFLGRGNISVTNAQYGFLVLFDTNNASKATNVMFDDITRNPVDVEDYCLTSDVYLTTNISLSYPSGRITTVNGNTKMEKGKPIRNLIQTTSFFTQDNYYTVDGKPYIALFGNLLSEFNPQYEFPESSVFDNLEDDGIIHF